MVKFIVQFFQNGRWKKAADWDSVEAALVNADNVFKDFSKVRVVRVEREIIYRLGA